MTWLLPIGMPNILGGAGADSPRPGGGGLDAPLRRARAPGYRAQAAALAILLAMPAAAIEPGEMFEDPAQEARARDIGRELRCLVCRNQSIFDSNAGLARDLRALVRERMEAGDTDTQVLSFVAERYGDYVLLDPPVHGGTALLWAAPVAFLLIGGGLAAVYLTRRRTAPQDAPDDEAFGRQLLGRTPK